ALDAIFWRDQWVAFAWVDSKVSTTTCSTFSIEIDGGRPGRGSSHRPSSRRSTNRCRHLPTVGWETPSRAATSLLDNPSAQCSTIRDRSANACADFGRRAHRSNCLRSSDVNSNRTFGRPDRAIPPIYHLTNEFLARDTRLQAICDSLGPAHIDALLRQVAADPAQPVQRR